MAYLNTTARGVQSGGFTEIEIPRYTPLNPAEVAESDGTYPSGVIDTSHAIKVGDTVFSASNSGVDDSTKVKSVVATSSDVTTVTLSKALISDLTDGAWLTFDRFQNSVNGAKFSFSKFPVPSISDQAPLFDIGSGQPLVDENGIQLVTDTQVAVSEIARKDNATSVTLPTGNQSPSVPVEEVFQESSEVANTLLGIPRAERQLSLFSDVSTLGLDEDDWEFYRSEGGSDFAIWDFRNTKSFGSHNEVELIENTNEQALEISAFPVPYTYPFGPRWAQFGIYDPDLYAQYLDFIRLGNLLYTYYSATERQAVYGSDFKDKFLDPSKVVIDDSDDTEFIGITDDEGFELIDTWTRTWVDINDNLLQNIPTGEIITPITVNNITGNSPRFSNTRPGYRTDKGFFGYLQSKRTYRYQPGRISGFTFGVRASSNSGSESNILEWGINNETDHYVFQLRGSTFNIVRRSTIPLESEVIEAQGLDPLEDQQLIPSGDPGDFDRETLERNEYYTIEIPRDNWNVDPLNGNGPSGYLLVPEEVTMYKIEFSWYGAIGANFYVYIPAGNGEARWVLVHRLVIENKLGQPCLENPNFRFRYSLNVRDTARLRFPQYVYKYGASMYIDGGDEGTVTLNSYSSGNRSISQSQDTSVLSVLPKERILNKEGKEKINNKIIVPKSLSATADRLTQVKIAKCKACPGFGHNYNYGLKTGEVGKVASFIFNDSTLSSISINPELNEYTDPQTQLFQPEDSGSKLIADGIYSTYIDVDFSTDVTDDQENVIGYSSANLVRIMADRFVKEPIDSTSSAGNPNSGFDSSGIVILNDGSRINLSDYRAAPEGSGNPYPYQMRLSQFDSYSASDIPLTGTEIDVQFLNPQKRESLGHVSEFKIGLTDKRPIDDNGTLKFEVEPEVFSEDLEENDTISGDFTQTRAGKDRYGYDNGEFLVDGTDIYEIDSRIPQPKREDSTDKTGRCSRARFKVLDQVLLDGIFTTTNPEDPENSDGVYLVLNQGTRFPDSQILDGEIGIDGQGTGVVFESEEITYLADGIIRSFAEVSGFPAGLSNDSPATVELTPVELQMHPTRFRDELRKSKIFRYNPFPLYAFVAMRDNAEINSISIRESVGKSQVTSTPNWITTSSSSIDIDDSGGRAVGDLPPINYTSENRLDSARIDNQCDQKLRPLTIMDSFYIGENETITYNLDDVYDFNREVVAPDLFDTEAMFLVATTPNDSSGNIELTLNTSEQ